MKLITKLASFFDHTIGFLAFVGILFLAATLLLVNYEVVARYILNQPTPWMLEIVEYALLYICFLGTAWVLKEEGHIKMDLVLNRLNPRAQVWLNIITSFVGIIICLIITWYGITVALDLYQSGQYYAAFLKPPKYIIIGIVPVGCFLLFIQFLRITYGYLKDLRALPAKGQEV